MYRFLKPAADVLRVLYKFDLQKLGFLYELEVPWGIYMYNNVDSGFGTSNTVLIRSTDL